MRLLPLFGLLVGCSTPADLPVDAPITDSWVEALPSADLPPTPGGLSLCKPPHVLSGEPVSFSASGATPGETILFIGGVGLSGSESCRGYMCSTIASPVLLGRAMADGDGVATLTRTPPASAPVGQTYAVQAFAKRGLRGIYSITSNVVQLQLLASFDDRSMCDDADICPDLPDADADGTTDACDLCAGYDDGVDGDGDGTPDACEDADGDGVIDVDDVCPGADDTQDGDGDGTPDGCEDADGDGVADIDDACPGFNDAIDGDGDGTPDACDECGTYGDWLVGTSCNGADFGGGCTSAETGYHWRGVYAQGGSQYACWWHTKNQAWNTTTSTNIYNLGLQFGLSPTSGHSSWCYARSADPCASGACGGGTTGYSTPGQIGAWGWCGGSAFSSGGFVCFPTAGGGGGASTCADADGDGVADGLDACPGADDALDADGDGTPDGCEDSDGDGVADPDDACEGYDDGADVDGDGTPDACDSCETYSDWLVGTACNGQDFGGGCTSAETGYHWRGVYTQGGVQYACWWHTKNQAWNTTTSTNIYNLGLQFGLSPTSGHSSWCYARSADPCASGACGGGTTGYSTAGNVGAWGWCGGSAFSSGGFVCFPNAAGGGGSAPCADADGDGVADGFDVCPGADDEVDGDGDGIPDGCDDSDGDGVLDGDDICPGHPDNVDTNGNGVPDGCEATCDYTSWLVGTACNGQDFGGGCTSAETGYHYVGVYVSGGQEYACWWHTKNQAWNTSTSTNIYNLATQFGLNPSTGRSSWCYARSANPCSSGACGAGTSGYTGSSNVGAWGWCGGSAFSSGGFVCFPNGDPECNP